MSVLTPHRLVGGARFLQVPLLLELLLVVFGVLVFVVVLVQLLLVFVVFVVVLFVLLIFLLELVGGVGVGREENGLEAVSGLQRRDRAVDVGMFRA